MNLEEEIFNKIANAIDDELLCSVAFFYKENKSSYRSLIIKPKSTIYRDSNSEYTFARIKTTGKACYIGFSEIFKHNFDELGIKYTCKESNVNEFLRIDIQDFLFALEHFDMVALMNKIFISMIKFTPFGCCSKYIECSNSRRCLHEDYLYAACACTYKKNLDVGRIFYGENKNA